MTPAKYTELAHKTKVHEFSTVNKDLIHGIIGLVGETGELADLLKKMFFYSTKTVNRDMIVDEVGDCLWYISLTLNAIGGTFEEAMEKNIAKLDLRHNKNNGVKDRVAEAKVQLDVC